MKLRVLAISAVLVTVLFAGVAAQSFAQEESLIPKWIKGVAGWWSNNKISDIEFLQAVDYLVNTGAIKPKIVLEQQAKIAELEAQIEELKNPPVEQNDDPLADLKDATINWSNYDLSDEEYFPILQKYIDAGYLGPFTLEKSVDEFGSPLTADDFAIVKDQLGYWGMDELTEQKASVYFNYLHVFGYISNPGHVEEPVTQETPTHDKDKSEIQARSDIIKNGNDWLNGKITDKEYLYNIMKMYQKGQLDSFGQYGDYDPQGEPTADSIAKLLSDKQGIDDLRRITKQDLSDNNRVNEYVIAIHDIFASLRE